jgi:hypothetical protein
MKLLNKCNKGLTIIEFIVSIALLGVVIVPLLMTFGGAYSLILKSKNAVELNSVARQIKVDVYMAYREGTFEVDYTPFLTKYSDPNNPIPSNDIYQDLPDAGQTVENFGVWQYELGRIHPNYKYTVTRRDDIFETKGPGMDLAAQNEIRCLIEIYKSDAVGNFDNANVARSFFINIPINFIKDEDGS